MKTLTEAHISCDSTPALPGAEAAYWAALPPALQRLLAHMMMWMKACCPVFCGGSAANVYALSQSMDVDDLAEAARRLNQDSMLNTGPADRYLSVRRLSLITALYGFTPARAGCLLRSPSLNIRARLKARSRSTRKRLLRERLRRNWTRRARQKAGVNFRALLPAYSACRRARRRLKPP